MPIMKLCPNRKNHPSHKFIDTSRDEKQFSRYKTIRHRYKKPVYYLDEDKMIRLYTNHKDRYVKLPFWYCPICGCAVHQDYIEPILIDYEKLMFLKP